jgi:predicted HNH restriction endonuclease
MTTELCSVLQANFPPDFNITESQGTMSLRDTVAERGRGYVITITREFGHIEARLEFESFAGQLAAHVVRRLEEQKVLIRELLTKYPQLNIKVTRQSVEEIMAPDTRTEDMWWLNFYCRLTEDQEKDYLLFADILLGLIFLLLPYESEGVTEGQSVEAISKLHERSRVNRALCLAYHGYDCQACGINMRQSYSGLSSDFIHVHHLNPVATAGITKPDPIREMVPLCPNCHGVAHLRSPPYTVAEIKNMIQPKV